LPTQSIKNASKPNVYVVIHKDEVRKVVTLHEKDMLCLFKHVRKITARYEASDLYTNGILDLGQFFQRLEMQAGINKISQLKMAPWENIFEHLSINNFKQMGDKTLNTLTVALLNPVALVEKKTIKKQYCLNSMNSINSKRLH